MACPTLDVYVIVFPTVACRGGSRRSRKWAGTIKSTEACKQNIRAMCVALAQSAHPRGTCMHIDIIDMQRTARPTARRVGLGCYARHYTLGYPDS